MHDVFEHEYFELYHFTKGRIAPFAALPWQAHIRIAEYQCGGVLVSRRFVITAAHCIEQARMKDIIVYLGELDTQDSGKVLEPLPAEKHYINRKIIHPNFKFRIAQPGKNCNNDESMMSKNYISIAILRSYQNKIMKKYIKNVYIIN